MQRGFLALMYALPGARLPPYVQRRVRDMQEQREIQPVPSPSQIRHIARTVAIFSAERDTALQRQYATFWPGPVQYVDGV